MSTSSRSSIVETRPARRIISNRMFGVLCTIPGLAGLVAFIVYPTLYNVFVSFLHYDNMSPIRFTGLSNYGWLLRSPEFYHSLGVSATYAVSSTLLAMLLGLVIAWSLTKIRRFQTVLRTLVILPWAIPLVISALVWKWLLNLDIGVVNYILSTLGLISKNIPFLADRTWAMVAGVVATGWVYTPFALVYVLAGLQGIPTELYESATVDGADAVQQFWLITLPLIRQQLLIIFIIVGMFTFRTPTVFFALTRGGPGKATYHLGIFLKDTVFQFLDFGHGSALGVVMTLIIIIVVLPIFLWAFRRS